ncbi:MAG: tetratricopeptide repeat protein [Candidatus Electrothrix sp. AR3]|nr:tetratricopeptide repeat protein [Candidatus Electrothrix sp. AR3]
MLSEFPQAQRYYENALRLYQEIGNKQSEASCLQQLCFLYIALSEYGEAWQSCKNALRLYRAIGFRLNLVNRLKIIGKKVCYLVTQIDKIKQFIKNQQK